MKTIDKDELYEHLGAFLKAKGVELQEGPYTRRIHHGCTILTDVINLSQQTLERAKTQMDKKLDRMRQVIHEKTAPKTSTGQSATQGQPADKVPSDRTTARQSAKKGSKKPNAKPAARR